MQLRLTAQDSFLMQYLRQGKGRLDAFNWDRLQAAERRCMLLQALLRVTTELESIRVVNSALVWASVYTDCTGEDENI